MIITRSKAKEVSRRLHEARTDPAHQCKALHVGADGKDYRLVAKPRAHRHILERHGHKVESVVSVEHGQEVLHVRVPLGAHDGDYLGYDLGTDKIVCLLCKGVKP